MTDITLSVPDISCDHCKTSIEGAVSPLAGVETASVAIDARTVDITYDANAIGVEAIIDAIEEQGYDVAR